jgi:hypothetical protein
VNRRVVTPTGKLKGKNKATFKNPKNFDPLSAALSPTGAFVIQTFFASSSAAGQRTASGNYGLSLAKVNGSQVDLGVAGAIVNAAIADAVDAVCFAFREEELTSSSEAGVNADPKTGVFYVRFDPNTFQPIGSVTTISRKVPSALATYEVFNTTALLPDGTGIVFAKQKSGKLEFRVQPLNGSCGPKKGGTYPLLQVTNPIIRDHLPLYGVSAAAAWCEQVGLC